MFTVYSHLAGAGGIRRWLRSYRSLAAARRYADAHAGFGVYCTVVDRADNVVHHTTR